MSPNLIPSEYVQFVVSSRQNFILRMESCSTIEGKAWKISIADRKTAGINYPSSNETRVLAKGNSHADQKYQRWFRIDFLDAQRYLYKSLNYRSTDKVKRGADLFQPI